MDSCVCTSVVGQIVWTSVINLLYSSLVAAPRVVQVSTKLTEGFRAIETLSSDWSRSALLSCVTTEAGAFSSTWLWLEHAPVPFVIANETQVLLGLSFLCTGGKLSRPHSTPGHSILQPGLWAGHLRDGKARLQAESLWLMSRRTCVSPRLSRLETVALCTFLSANKKWVSDKYPMALTGWAGSQHDVSLSCPFQLLAWR